MQQPLTPQPSRMLSVQSKQSLRLVQIFGIFHIINSVLILSFDIALLSVFKIRRALNDQASAIWSSPFFMTTGILGVIIFCKPQSRALIATHNVFAIISCFLAVVVLVFSALGVEFYDCKTWWFGTWVTQYSPYECRWSVVRDISQPMYGCLIAYSVLELIFSIISTVFSFKLHNCCPCTPTGGCECTDCSEGCQCCEQNQMSASLTYQMQPVNTMAYPPNVMQTNYVMRPQYLPHQYPQPTYIQNVPNQALITSAPIQSNVEQNEAQIVTNAAGQQFVLVPISQLQQPAAAASPVVATAAPTVPPAQQISVQPPSYTKEQGNE